MVGAEGACSMRLALVTASTRRRPPRICPIAEAAASPSDERVHQEIVLYAARIDVDEEISRLVTHVAEFRRVLDKGGACGKRLDFLCQELNREANTLGSKSVANEMTRISVELKVLIEQMREQVQNIE